MPNERRPSQEAIAEARWQAFQVLEETADLTASYARSIGEAAYRRDELTVGVHIRQLIDCARSMARVYREGLQNGNGQDVAAKAGRSAAADRPAQPAGDGVDRRQPE